MKNCFAIIFYIIYFLNFLSCNNGSTNDYQLVIVNASLFNVHTGQIENNKSVFIKNGLIEKISKTNDSDYSIKKAASKIPTA